MTAPTIQRLADANPVAPEARAWIAIELELELELGAIKAAGRWRQRRSGVALAIAAASLLLATVLLVAPALGLGIPGIDFLKAEKAPPDVVKSFAGLGIGAPPGMDPNVIPGETRKVMTTTDRDGYGWILWVAPTQEGGLCYEWQRLKNGGEAGCDKAGQAPLSVTWSRPAVMEPPRYDARDFRRITGFAHSQWIDGVEIHLSDDSTVEPNITWVSAPISAGFFFYEPPPGLYVRYVVGLKDGTAVVDDRGGLENRNDPVPSPFAGLAKKKEVASVETSAGTATAWEAPTKIDEKCRWVQIRREEHELAPCMPRAREGQQLELQAFSIGRAELLTAFAPNYRSLELDFRAQGPVQLKPQDGIALYVVDRAEDLLSIRGIRSDGRTAATIPAPVPR